MTNTLVGANLQGISDGARLEQITADLLSREGYDVDPTGVRGADAGRDSLLEQDGENGILHCSAQTTDVRTKIRKDAKKAFERPEDFEFFIFATTAQMSGTKRDRLEDEIQEEYDWRTSVWDFQRLRNRLMGNPQNHDLVKNHLRVSPSEAFGDVENQLEAKQEERVERLVERAAPRGEIIDKGPIIAVHIIPSESVSDPPDRIATELPEPPYFTYRSSGPQSYGDFVLTAPHREFTEDEFSEYVYLDVDGWVEAVTTRLVDDRYNHPAISLYIDERIVVFVKNLIQMYKEENIYPPFYVFISVLHGEEYQISQPQNIYIEPTNPRSLDENKIILKRATIEGYDDSIPGALRRSLYQLWNKSGWEEGSLHYHHDDGSFEWRPYSERDKP